MQSTDDATQSWIQNVIAGLTVSFVAISLGAAFGILSTRGAFVGILSAGLIALITSLFGGTRIQCSGPTAPMTAVTVAVIVDAKERMAQSALGGASVDHFVNIVIYLAGALLVVMALLRLGRFITLVPKVVISGFMNGIAVLIWLDQVKKLFGLGGMEAMGGVLALNIAVASVTLVLLFVVPGLLKKHVPQLAHYLPGTLMGILIMTPLVYMLGLDVELVNLDTQLGSWSELSAMVQAQWPTTWSGDVLTLAFPFALQLAFLCYLDTLLTSLVVDKLVQAKFKSQECTAQNKELLAQGVANASVALIGGIPGAQATIRSVLILNEGATMRIAGVMTGVFVFVEMILFQDLISTIPTAVFAGILFKVGYDVFDWEPVFAALSKDTANKPSPMNWFFIVGTTGITLLMDLNTAVIGFCILFYVGKHFFSIEDMPDGVEKAMSDEN